MFKKIGFFISLLLVSSCQSTSHNLAKYEEFVSSGDSFPLTEITSIDGTQIDLLNRDKKKLVILFASWCSDSNRLIKALNQSQLLHDEQVEVIAIAREEDVETVKAWRDKLQLDVPMAVDPDRSIYQRFASGGIPRLIMVANDNYIINMKLVEGSNQLAGIKWSAQ